MVGDRPIRQEGQARHPLLAAEYDNMLRCIRCGLCLAVCPTYQETFHEAESPRGRIAIARAYAEGHLDLSADLWAHEESCLLCEACTAVCPADVHMEEIGVALRAAVVGALQATPLRRPRRQTLALRLAFDYLFADMRRFRMAAGLAGLYRRSGAQALARRSGLLRLLGLQRAESFLPAITGPFLVPEGQVWSPDGAVQRRVALFAGCVMSTAFAEIDRATARVLAANGCLVVAVPGQGCCGALHVHNGELAGAAALARRNVDAFADLDVDAIVVNAAGCGATLKQYGHLLAADPAYATGAAAMAAKVRDVTEFLAGIDLNRRLGEISATVTYQEPCHLAHAQRVQAAPRTLLRAIPGLRLVEMAEADLCCGSAGIYNLTAPEMSEALMRRKVANALATGADLIVSANPGCMLQLKAGLQAAGANLPVKHIVELLDEAYQKAKDR